MDIELSVNGRRVAAAVEPRLHLADFLRERLHLTGTHLGCEHGVCGACTLLLDGAPARSCITFAAASAGREVRSIEGFESDPVMAALRTAFSAEHALQCGFCTPGMLVTAWDIVRRRPGADEAAIRLELAGNLCRCTGYSGIVRAIRLVLDRHLENVPQAPAPLPVVSVPDLPLWAPAVATPDRPAGDGLRQTLKLAVALDALWAALRDPALVASCVPGARLTLNDANHIEGEMVVALGPVQARFAGGANITYGDHTGTVTGQGQDRLSGTRLSATAAFHVAADKAGSVLVLDITYSLRGPLSQLARAPVVRAFADEIAGMVARNLQARLTGGAVPPARRLGGLRLALRVLWARLRRR